ncbi:MAG: hypothetical protein J6Y32_02695 [Bacteroidales bacterium]|nr:hypothetical protein [Bacteroidales bacterium]
MKKYILPAALLFAAAISCTKETPESENSFASKNDIPMRSVQFVGARAEMSDENGTKTLLDGNGLVRWSLGDALSVFDKLTKSLQRFESELDELNNRLATFSGQLPTATSEFCAIYPYNENASMSEDVVSTTLPATQQAVAGSFAADADLGFAAGNLQENADALNFNHLCALLSFKMPSYVDGASQVVVASKSGTAMAGNVQVSTADAAISSVSGSSSITLGGNALQADGTYYVSVAPGTYTNGFTFTVTTAAGNSYTAQTTRTLAAEAGHLYPLGTLGLVLNVTPVVTIAHTTNSSGELSGSTATLSAISLPAEYAGMVTGWSVILKRNGTEVRRLTSASSSISGQMSTRNSYAYLPQGNYDIEATYTLSDGKSKKLTGTATSPAPTVSLTLGGYTNYDDYMGTNGRTKSTSSANSLDGSTVYSPSVKVNVTEALLEDSKYGNTTCSYSYDGGAATSFSGNSASLGNKTAQSWAAHTLTATCTFDGVTGNASKTFSVTGLPFSDSAPGTTSYWSLGKSCWHDGNRIAIGDGTNNSLKVSVSFYCPASINVAFSSSVEIKTASLFNRNGVTVKAGGSQIVSQDGPTGTNVSSTYSLSSNSGTLTSSNGNIEYEGKRWGANSVVWINSASVTYR